MGSPSVGRLLVSGVFVHNLFVGRVFDDGIQWFLKQDDDGCNDDLFISIHGYNVLDSHGPDTIRLQELNYNINLEVDATRVAAGVQRELGY